jgi:hypothetical protein
MKKTKTVSAERYMNKENVKDFLQRISGRVHFVVLIKDRPALEIKLKDKNIIVDIKNPVLALTLGMEEFMKHKGGKEISFVKELKRIGYNVKIKYKMFEFEL